MTIVVDVDELVRVVLLLLAGGAIFCAVYFVACMRPALIGEASVFRSLVKETKQELPPKQPFTKDMIFTDGPVASAAFDQEGKFKVL